MAARRDYKQGNRPGADRGKRSGKGGGVFFGLLFGLAGGLIIAGGLIWYFYTEPSGFKKTEAVPAVTAPLPGKEAKVEPKPAPTVESAGDKKPAEPAAGTPQYSFYDILAGNQPAKPLDPPKIKEVWWLQVVALKEAATAEELKVRLTLLNLGTVVQRIDTDAGPRFRVRVGPFNSEEASVSARATLLANNFEPRLLKEPVSHQ